MSALKENKLVWEVDGKLKFAKVQITPDMRAMIQKCIATKPLQGADYERLLEKLPDGAGRRSARIPTGKVVCKLPKDYDTEEPFIDPTPRDWKWVSIESLASGLNLVTGVSRIKFLPQAMKILGLDLPTEGLSMEQAVSNGRVIEAAYQRLEL